MSTVQIRLRLQDEIGPVVPSVPARPVFCTKCLNRLLSLCPWQICSACRDLLLPSLLSWLLFRSQQVYCVHAVCSRNERRRVSWTVQISKSLSCLLEMCARQVPCRYGDYPAHGRGDNYSYEYGDFYLDGYAYTHAPNYRNFPLHATCERRLCEFRHELLSHDSDGAHHKIAAAGGAGGAGGGRPAATITSTRCQRSSSTPSRSGREQRTVE